MIVCHVGLPKHSEDTKHEKDVSNALDSVPRVLSVLTEVWLIQKQAIIIAIVLRIRIWISKLKKETRNGV